MKTCRSGLHQYEPKKRNGCPKCKKIACRAAGNRQGSMRAWRAKNPEFVSYASMKQRCLNPKNPAYHRYGGRGITICEQWLGDDGWPQFLKDMGRKPTLNHSIERKNNNLGYSPDNCKWATKGEQQNNREVSVKIAWRGETFTVTEWARKLGITPASLTKRLNSKGWTLDEALTEPSQAANIGKLYSFNGQEKTLSEWSEVVGVASNTLAVRLWKGWNIERALTQPTTDPRTKLYSYQGESLPLTEWAERLGVSKKTLENRVNMGWPDERVLGTPIVKKRNS